MKLLNKKIRNRYIFILDILLIAAAYVIAQIFIFSMSSIGYCWVKGSSIIIATPLIYCPVMLVFGVYYTDWVCAGAVEYMKLIFSCAISGLIVIVFGYFLMPEVFFPKFNIAANFIISVFICSLRFSLRILYKFSSFASAKGKGKKALVIGAGNLAVAFLRDVNENNGINYDIIGLIDDDETKQKSYVYGARVIGKSKDILRVCRERNAEEIIFAIYNLKPSRKSEILEVCSQTGLKINIIPGVEAALNGELSMGKMREIEIEDLLDREPIMLDNKLIAEDIHKKTVMVTGGGGSIGSELCRQIVKFEPERLIIVDIYENTTYELQNELEEKYPGQKLDVLIASVRDKERLDIIFEKYRPNIVFHAAAHKHVPLMEFSPCEAIKNNIFGTYNTAVCAEKYGADRFVLISTDKAVNPTNVMGASKRMCEMIVQTMQKIGRTEFVAVRFGNVLGSNGSVIPRFKKQIAAGGPVTVTHPEITRFFMTIPEAAQLVLQAASYARGGEIFVLDMGEPVKIYDLARKMIALSGVKDIEIKFTGLRPGEKLYEEILMSEEGLRTTAHSKIFVGQPVNIDMKELSTKLKRLNEAIAKDGEEVKRIISEAVPTYKYAEKKTLNKNSTYEVV